MLSDYFNLNQPAPGRAVYAARGVARKAEGQADLLAATQRVEEDGLEALRLNDAWRGREISRATYTPEIIKLDSYLDRAVGAIDNSAMSFKLAFPPESDLHQASTRLLDEAFKNGVAAITKIPIAEEILAVDLLLERLKGSLSEEVSLLKLTALVERVEEIRGQIGVALGKLDKTQLTFDKVKHARDRCVERYFHLVALILAKHPGDTAEDLSIQRDLMAPILEQNEAMKRLYRARNSSGDINPESGEPQLDDPA